MARLQATAFYAPQTAGLGNLLTSAMTPAFPGGRWLGTYPGARLSRSSGRCEGILWSARRKRWPQWVSFCQVGSCRGNNIDPDNLTAGVMMNDAGLALPVCRQLRFHQPKPTRIVWLVGTWGMRAHASLTPYRRPDDDRQRKYTQCQFDRGCGNAGGQALAERRVRIYRLGLPRGGKAGYDKPGASQPE